MIHALLLLLAPTAVQGNGDPLAHARAGKLQCGSPNIEKKSCMSLTRYAVQSDGSYEAVTTLLIAPSPVITMEVKSSGKAQDGMLCGTVRQSDFAAGTLTADGKPAEPAMIDAIRAQVAGAIAPMDGKLGCARETRDGVVNKVEVTLNGVAHPEMTQRALWVAPGDGYELGL